MANYPKAIGPYSVYKECGDIVYVSGQLPVNPKTGEIESDDIQVQTKQSLENVKGVLDELGLGFNNIVKTLVFLSDINDFVPMNEIYGTYFKEPYPARSCVAVKDIPKGAKVEVEVIVSKK